MVLMALRISQVYVVISVREMTFLGDIFGTVGDMSMTEGTIVAGERLEYTKQLSLDVRYGNYLMSLE